MVVKEDVVVVSDLTKVYRTHVRGEGLGSAVKSLFFRKYEDKVAVDNISFTIKKGEIVGLIGPNGAGKSTTIKALSGLLFPTSGSVKVLGYVPWDERVKYVKHLGVVLGQKEQLIWDIPAVDSFYLNKDLYEIPEKLFMERLDYMTKLLEVDKIMYTPVRDLSLGERMKCKLVLSLLHKPDIVLLDEPSIGLDVIAKDKFRDFIKEVNKKEGTTFIITTHDMQEIEQLCEKVIIINHGIVIYNGELREIRKKFYTKKFLKIKLETKGSPFKLKNTKTIEQKDYSIKIEADTSKIKIKNVIDYLLEHYDIADITISDPPIEKIIQIVFSGKDEKK
jgi:ABC-2 type transport system ATP-binding protein